jgi:pilus assembly protein CpaC
MNSRGQIVSRGRTGSYALCAMAALSGLLIAGRAEAAPRREAKHSGLIQIGVEVVEVDLQKTQRLGVQWLSQILISEQNVPSLFKVGSFTRTRIAADLEAMFKDGAADLLANPKLVTRDGTEAKFHAGGELPYAATGSLGTVTVDFKPYGVNLKINPTIEPDERIALTIDAEVSGPDDTHSVTLAGNVVPGIRSRQISSELTLTPGSTLTMAGLIQNQKQWTRTGVPGLMRIPLLGRLFSHKVETNERTSIVVFITPTILESDAEKPGTPDPAFPRPLPPKDAKAPAQDDLLDAAASAEAPAIEPPVEVGDIHG